jgi:DUF3102 family protein
MSDHNRLDALCREIREEWQNADKNYDDARLRIGRLLVEAKTLVKDGEWKEWCRENVPGKTERDIRRLIAMAKSADPEAAREAEKTKAREGMKATRERTNVSPPQEVKDAALSAIEAASPPPQMATPPSAEKLPRGTPARACGTIPLASNQERLAVHAKFTAACADAIGRLHTHARRGVSEVRIDPAEVAKALRDDAALGVVDFAVLIDWLREIEALMVPVRRAEAA